MKVIQIVVIAFMLSGVPTVVVAQPTAIAQEEFKARRAALQAALPDATILLVGNEQPADSRLWFHQHRNMLYLTGYREPSAALVISPGLPGGATLFVLPNNRVQELWEGKRKGPGGAQAATGIASRPRGELTTFLDSLMTAGEPLVVGTDTTIGGPTWTVLQALRQRRSALAIRDGQREVLRLRARKSVAEQSLLAAAAQLTTLGAAELLRATAPGVYEFELEALLAYTYRRNGGDGAAYPQIVASGPNALTLHYTTNDRRLQAGDLLVLDIGASYHGYASDFSRTLPASGRFTPDQRAIYDIVYHAQQAAQRSLKAGVSFNVLADSVRSVLAPGLQSLGLIESPDARYDPAPGEFCIGRTPQGCPQWYLYYMHALGHGVGLDVHDPDAFQTDGKVADGSVVMLEVGIYVRPDVLTALPDTPRNRTLVAHAAKSVARYAGIAVRLEDKFSVRSDSVSWLTKFPRTASEIEAGMRERATRPVARDTALVNRFKRPP
jgi:Xaa-Pro aminopeptidase